MLSLILWIFVLIIWIGILIIRMQPQMKRTSGNSGNIVLAIVFIILSILNIIGSAINLNNNNNISTESETLVETTSSDEEFTQDEYYITGTIY